MTELANNPNEIANASRSIQLARQHQLGPFKPRFQKAVTAAPSVAIITTSKEPITACEIGDITFSIESGYILLKESQNCMRLRMVAGGLALSMFIDRSAYQPKPVTSFNVQNRYSEFWLTNTVPMNQTIAKHMIRELRAAIRNTQLMQHMINQEVTFFEPKGQIDAATLVQYCTDNLDVLEQHLPANQPLKIGSRFPADVAKIEELDKIFSLPKSFQNLPPLAQRPLQDLSLIVFEHSFRRGDLQMAFHNIPHLDNLSLQHTPISQKVVPFPDKAVEVKALPVFPEDTRAPITGQYAAFGLQRHGVKYWVQFADVNGNEIQDFMMVEPADFSGINHRRQLYKNEALETLQMIRDEVDAVKHPWVSAVLTRLTEAAQHLETDIKISFGNNNLNIPKEDPSEQFIQYPRF